MRFLDYQGLGHLVSLIQETYVAKEPGKELTANDLTDILKGKLDGIEPGAQVNTVDTVNSKTGNVVLKAEDIRYTTNTIKDTLDLIIAEGTARDTLIATKADKETTYTKTDIDTIVEGIDHGVITVNQKAGNVVIDGTEINLSPEETTTLLEVVQALREADTGLKRDIDDLDSRTHDSSHTDAMLATKVDKVSGKALSTNDLTDALKSKLDQIEAGSQVNIIETIRRNGSKLTVKDKGIDISVPTKMSQLINDNTYQTEAEIRTLIQDVGKLKKEVVVELPPAEGADDNTIYLVRNEQDTGYKEYMIINGTWEILGDTAAVDFTGYVHEDHIRSITNTEIDQFMNA